jgi:hypothetical protein
MLVPGNVDEYLQAAFVGDIQQPQGRDVVHANAVCAELAQLAKVRLGLPTLR